MVVVGLTGGIGSGKSTVASLLSGRGAVIVDADLIARQVVEPGGPAYDPIVARFGPAVVASDGTLDRPALAAIVFADESARLALEAITHPAIQTEMARQMLEHVEGTAPIILDIPLLKVRREPMMGVIVVDLPEEVAVARLVAFRDFDEGDARRRIAAQMSRDERRALADIVVDNSGSPDQLEAEIDRVWAWMESLS